MQTLANDSNLIFEWGDKTQAASLCGYSDCYLRTARKKYWLEGVHYSKLSSSRVIYNLTLIKDWVANVASPDAHQRAINLYRKSLVSNQGGDSISD